ncbi:hypothetical protein THIOKS1440016 [Thiocapsa sp. KS1]|nr:hypothetical protein THIOKS1440016 [Thiocapsa sp. KS1]
MLTTNRHAVSHDRAERLALVVGREDRPVGIAEGVLHKRVGACSAIEGRESRLHAVARDQAAMAVAGQKGDELIVQQAAHLTLVILPPIGRACCPGWWRGPPTSPFEGSAF